MTAPRTWTPEQDAALRRIYASGKRTGALTRLSRDWGIPIATLVQRARRALGLPALLHKYVWTPEQDAALRAAYLRPGKGQVRRLAARWGIPATTLSTRAVRELGLPPLRHQGPATPWTALEHELLDTHPQLGDKALRKLLARRTGITRTPKAIEIERHRRGLSAAPDGGRYYSPQLIASGLGCNPHTVYRWIDRDMLKASRAGNGHFLSVTPAALRAFLIDYTAHWEAAKADKWFLVDVLTGKTGPKQINESDR